MSARIAPGTPNQVGSVNRLILSVLGAATGGHPLNVFTTLARHRSLFRRWLLFAGGLMPGGLLPRRDSELVILRVAHNCGSEYERVQHEVLGARAGLSAAEIAAAGEGPEASVLDARQRLLLQIADELHATRDLTDATWAQLAAELSDPRECLELCLLVGHYEMLAMTLNAARVQPDPAPSSAPPPPPPPPRAVRLAQRLLER